MSTPPTPRGAYIRGQRDALSSSPDLCDSPCRVGIGRCYSDYAIERRCIMSGTYFFFGYLPSVTRNVINLYVIVDVRGFYFLWD